MRLIILFASALVLISCIILAIFLIKDKKRVTPIVLLIALTFFAALFMCLKMLGVL